jgi:hypothetical protein
MTRRRTNSSSSAWQRFCSLASSSRSDSRFIPSVPPQQGFQEAYITVERSGSPCRGLLAGSLQSVAAGKTPLRSTIWRAVLLALSLVASAASARDLIRNGRFATNVDGWPSLDPNVVLTWSPTDADGAATSGSLQATNSSSAALDSGFIQCAGGIKAGVSYNYGGKLLIPSSNPPGQSVLKLEWNDASDCSGNLLGAEVMATAVFDRWAAVSGSHVAPPGSQGAVIYGELVRSRSTHARVVSSIAFAFRGPPNIPPACRTAGSSATRSSIDQTRPVTPAAIAGVTRKLW